jgi:hypothetical protein
MLTPVGYGSGSQRGHQDNETDGNANRQQSVLDRHVQMYGAAAVSGSEREGQGGNGSGRNGAANVSGRGLDG